MLKPNNQITASKTRSRDRSEAAAGDGLRLEALDVVEPEPQIHHFDVA
jgi:hypothetical protein